MKVENNKVQVLKHTQPHRRSWAGNFGSLLPSSKDQVEECHKMLCRSCGTKQLAVDLGLVCCKLFKRWAP